ncbi:efflux RND transporter periplasmic adaptor subunit [Bradyrhizobium betae]
MPPESDLALFKPGVTVQLVSSAYPGETFAGKVIKVADYVDPAARSIKVRLAVPNQDRRLKAEMFVHTAKLQAASFQGISVPSKAVFLADNRSYVFVRTAREPFPSAVLSSWACRCPALTEVVEGLKDGDMVVIEGNLYLQDILRDATAVQLAAPRRRSQQRQREAVRKTAT